MVGYPLSRSIRQGHGDTAVKKETWEIDVRGDRLELAVILLFAGFDSRETGFYGDRSARRRGRELFVSRLNRRQVEDDHPVITAIALLYMAIRNAGELSVEFSSRVLVAAAPASVQLY